MVFGAGDTLPSKKTRALTPAQLRAIFTRLLRRPAPGPVAIAKEVTYVLRRNEESRIYHWKAASGIFPPRRPDTS